jgi:hypothetical protein
VSTDTGVITGGAGNGQISLRSATIATNANAGSTIQLGNGTYTLSIPGDVSDRTWTGAGVFFNPLIGDLNINAAGTTIQGMGPANTTITQTTGGDRVLTANPTGAALFGFTLTGVAVTGGRDAAANRGGGAVFVGGQNDNTVISNCAFRDNKVIAVASLGGGAIINTGGNITINNCTFGGPNPGDENTATTSGGAISYDSSDFVHSGGTGTLTITNSTFVNNQAASSASGGGAVNIADSNLSTAIANINDSTFTGNQAPNQVDALTDGFMLVRYMLGMRGDALISGAIGPNANRVLAKEIEDYIKMLMPD